MKEKWFWPAAILFLPLAYLPALQASFVKDDFILILSAQTESLALFFRSWPGGFFRPSSEALFALQRLFFGQTPFAYHALSLCAHACAALLLYRLLRRMLVDSDTCYISIVVFAIHPASTESVSWISGQMSLFAGLFTLILLNQPTDERSPRGLIPILIIALGLGFYESFIIAPVLWLILDKNSLSIQRKMSIYKSWPAIFLTAFLLGIYLYWRFAVLGLRGGNYDFAPSISTALVNLIYYIYLLMGGSALAGRTLYYQPESLYSDSTFSYIFSPLFILTILLFTATAATFLYSLVRKNRSPLSGDHLVTIVWLLIALLPALILPERPRRLAYCAIPAFSLLVAQSFCYLRRERVLGNSLLPAALVLYLGIMGATLYTRNLDWQQAGSIEKDIPNIVIAEHCTSIVIDAPNLLGDALFFNPLSTGYWIAHVRGRHIPVLDAQQLHTTDLVNLSGCLYYYDNGRFVRSEGGAPRFTRGKNWSLPPDHTGNKRVPIH